MYNVLLSPGVNPTAVNKYINWNDEPQSAFHFIRMKIDEVSRGKDIHEGTAVCFFGKVYLADVFTGQRVYSSGPFRFSYSLCS
jgi:hypothetical protein